MVGFRTACVTITGGGGVGAGVGVGVGCGVSPGTVGEKVGTAVGAVGDSVGDTVGERVGAAVGAAVWTSSGDETEMLLGWGTMTSLPRAAFAAVIEELMAAALWLCAAL